MVVSIDRTAPGAFSCAAPTCGPASWAISGSGCGGAAIPDGDSANVTAGAGPSFSINTAAITTAGLTCSLTATVRDAYARPALQTLPLVVRAPCVGGRVWEGGVRPGGRGKQHMRQAPGGGAPGGGSQLHVPVCAVRCGGTLPRGPGRAPLP